MAAGIFRTGPGPLAGFLFACVLCLGLGAQSTDGLSDEGSSAGSAGAIAAPEGESTVLLDVDGDTGRAEAAAEPSTVFLLLRVVLVLALVCACIYGVVWLLKKSSRVNAARDPYLRSLAQLPLSQNASVRVVSVGAQAFLVGVTDQAITMLAEISDRELVDAMNLEAERTAGEPVGPFEGVLSRFLPGMGQTGTGQLGQKGVKTGRTPSGERDGGVAGSEAAGTAASITADFIKRQRERLANARRGAEAKGEGEE